MPHRVPQLHFSFPFYRSVSSSSESSLTSSLFDESLNSKPRTPRIMTSKARKKSQTRNIDIFASAHSTAHDREGNTGPNKNVESERRQRRNRGGIGLDLPVQLSKGRDSK